ncbi:hypothetical protein CIW50_09520 [Tardiphaga sp. P9-11]|nr:hypothetical protein CIW50_09520 [Tardiphaga sp. P9-11]
MLDALVTTASTQVKAIPIKPYRLFQGHRGLENHYTEFVTRPLDTIPLRAVDEATHRQIISVLKGLKRHNTRERILSENALIDFDKLFSPYSNAMSKWDQRINKNVVAPRMNLQRALELTSKRLALPHWAGSNLASEQTFQSFCFNEVFFERQRGNYTSAIKTAYALHVILSVAPESIGMADTPQICMYRGLIAYVGGWAAYQARNHALERIFVGELVNVYRIWPDPGIRNRIRNHLGYHHKNYRGPFLILKDRSDAIKSPMNRIYDEFLGSNGGSTLHNASRSALEMGADPNTRLRQLENRTPLAGLNEAVLMDQDSGDPEGALFSMITLADWYDQLEMENNFSKQFSSAQAYAKTNKTCMLANTSLLRLKGEHHLRKWKKSGSSTELVTATRTLDTVASIYDKSHLPDRANETRSLIS